MHLRGMKTTSLHSNYLDFTAYYCWQDLSFSGEFRNVKHSNCLQIGSQYFEMGIVVYAEENILNYLCNLTKSNSTAVGLIIGQSTKETYHVAHFATTKNPINNGHLVEPLRFNTVKDINHVLIFEHKDLVNERLPGGFSVLGTFICSPTDIFSNKYLERTLKNLIYGTKTRQPEESFPFSSAGSEKLLFYYNPVDHKYKCVSSPIENRFCQFEPVDWKFQNSCTKWCQISSKFGINFPVLFVKQQHKMKSQLENVLSNVKHLLQNSVLVVDGKVLNKDHSVESFINTMGKMKMKNSTDIHYLETSVFTPLLQDPIGQDAVLVENSKPTATIKGTISSQAFISQKGTIEDAARAVKEDIFRSLETRVSLYLNSQEKSDVSDVHLPSDTIHEFPRRISATLPNGPFCFSDYLFSDEDCNLVIISLRLLLDIEVTEKNINLEYEMYAASSTHYDSSSNKLISSTHSDDLLRSTLPTKLLIAAVSFAVILIAIAVALRN